MPRAFANLAFTSSVRDRQSAMGSSAAYDRFLEPNASGGECFGPDEIAFISARDGFYMATVSETGWPYVQFRGGPRGFLRVLDDTTVGFADFRGNRQYISTGNLDANPRVSLFLMDYPNRARLKILGRARMVEGTEDPDLLSRLMPEGYKARPERAVIISNAGFDWNCPQHIPERYTIEELEPALAKLRAEIKHLRAENSTLKEAIDGR